MDYNILFFAVIFVLFCVGTYAMVVFKKGGSVSLFPINGVGLIWQKSKIWMSIDEEGKNGFFDHKVTIGIIFIFLVFHWQDGFTGDREDWFDNENLQHGY